jgi:hypothetical protein
VWLCGGIEKDGAIHWSQPEIVLYADDPKTRMSYPCLIEDGGKYFLTETQKTIARVHEIESTLLEGLWAQHEAADVAQEGLVVNLHGDACKRGATSPLPPLPALTTRDGFSVDVWLRFDSTESGQVLWDWRNEQGEGAALTTADNGALGIVLNDGIRQARWDCDAGLLKPGTWHHVAAIVDGGPKIITLVVDGVLCDGGAAREQGWQRFDPAMEDLNGAADLTVAPSLKGEVGALRIYGRALRTSEAVGNWRAGRR